MKEAVVCPECGGFGFWDCDEVGREYKTPQKCEDCNGSGARIKEGKGFQLLFRYK